MIRILIADDHPVVRMGVKQILEKVSDMEVKGEASDGAEALDKITKKKFDVVLLDISMPGIGGLEVLKQLKRKKPSLPVLLLSMHPEKQYAIRALKSGASGYLTKKSAPYELEKAIRTVSQGEKYISSSLAKILASHLESYMNRPPHETLSNQEYQVFSMICMGNTQTEIAQDLDLSIKTISTYRNRIMKKMKMKNDVELSRYAMQNHLFD
jgi:DNA-binding NarL/FixJ family response regulator